MEIKKSIEIIESICLSQKESSVEKLEEIANALQAIKLICAHYQRIRDPKNIFRIKAAMAFKEIYDHRNQKCFEA